MSDWKLNAGMYWHDGFVWHKITDHGRSSITVTPTRIETSNRMASGTMRRFVVAKKNEYSVSWSMIPSDNNSFLNGRAGMNTVDGGWAGNDIRDFHESMDGAFKMRLRKGVDLDKPITDGSIEEVLVMITSFNYEVVKRGPTDLWNLDITLTEV